MRKQGFKSPRRRHYLSSDLIGKFNLEQAMALHGLGKIEHSGPKRGRGAWCRKADAKKASSKRRRRAARAEITEFKLSADFDGRGKKSPTTSSACSAVR